jgi:hypothetical protein
LENLIYQQEISPLFEPCLTRDIPIGFSPQSGLEIPPIGFDLTSGLEIPLTGAYLKVQPQSGLEIPPTGAYLKGIAKQAALGY